MLSFSIFFLRLHKRNRRLDKAEAQKQSAVFIMLASMMTKHASSWRDSSPRRSFSRHSVKATLMHALKCHRYQRYKSDLAELRIESSYCCCGRNNNCPTNKLCFDEASFHPCFCQHVTTENSIIQPREVKCVSKKSYF